MKEFDVAIIGAGIVGSLLAWRLARTNLRVALLEKTSDVANGATRANSGILHSGIHEEPDSELFVMCKKGRQWYGKWAKDLDYPYVHKPTVVIAKTSEETEELSAIACRHKNSLTPKWLKPKDIKKRWPFLTPDITAAIEVEDSALISPYETCRAVVENAQDNGLNFLKNFFIEQAEFKENYWHITGQNQKIMARMVIIAAGEGTNEAGRHFSLPELPIKLINGAYFMLSKKAEPQFNEIFFSAPTKTSKGIVLQKTVHDNLMIGPDAINKTELAEAKRAWHRYCQLWQDCQSYIPGLNRKEVIRSFTGNRVNIGSGFQTENLLDNKQLLRISGIKSPGLTAAPALAAKVEQLLKKQMIFSPKQQTVDKRISLANATKNQKQGNIVCRCEKIFTAQIKEAIKRGAVSIETLRWQTRAGMGECQGSFCRPQLIKLLKETLKLESEKVIQKTADSQMFTGDLK